jgi:hypothetical protein
VVNSYGGEKKRSLFYDAFDKIFASHLPNHKRDTVWMLNVTFRSQKYLQGLFTAGFVVSSK